MSHLFTFDFPSLTKFFLLKKFVEKLVQAFDDVMPQYGIGTVAEIYDGDPPHRPKGAISSAWSIGELLRMMYILEKV